MNENNQLRPHEREWAAPMTIQRAINRSVRLLEEMKEIIRRNPTNARLHSALLKVEKMCTDLDEEIEQMKLVEERDIEGRREMLDIGIFMDEP